jgi:hypothetical protein
VEDEKGHGCGPVFDCIAGSRLRPTATKTTLTVVERATTDVVADVEPAGDSVGDVLGFANEAFDAANETKVGTGNGAYVRTAAPGA